MDNKLSEIIGKRINALLAEQDKKQKELAAYLQIQDNTISYFVSGRRIPNTEQIIKIADFFNVSADFMLGRTDIKTTDKDIHFVCDYTGLSEEAINELKNHYNKLHLDTLDYLLAQPVFGFDSFLEEYGLFQDYCFAVIELMEETIAEYEPLPQTISKSLANEINDKLEKIAQAEDQRDLCLFRMTQIVNHFESKFELDIIAERLQVERAFRELSRRISILLDEFEERDIYADHTEA